MQIIDIVMMHVKKTLTCSETIELFLLLYCTNYSCNLRKKTRILKLNNCIFTKNTKYQTI